MSRPARERIQLFAPPAVDVERRPDGTLVLRAPAALQPYPARAGAWLEHWAEAAPDRLFLQERGADGLWHGATYAEAAQRVQRLGAGLLQRDLSAARPIAILSDNGLEHALLMLAAMHVGIPVAPLSPAYSLLSRDFGKLRGHRRAVAARAGLRGGPGPVSPRRWRRSAMLHDAEIVAGGSTVDLRGATPLAALYALGGTSAVDRAAAAVNADTIAKFLFTSGSTGEPKAVINTHRMLCASQQARVQTWPFLAAQPPVIVDWLPWSHTFGGNHNFNLVLRNGGTLYIDAGKPAPGLFARTIANLREIAPTIYFNVPRGYDMLIDALRADAALRGRFFSRLRLLFYAGAALPQNLWDALGELARETLGRPVPMVTAWGSTETAPLAADCHFQAPRSGVIGIPVPGTELKLVPENGKLEIRVRGANVTAGYWRQPELTREAFDEESFYRIGDAVRFLDPAHPERGLVFDGRIAEDFKLSTGTRVHVGNLRIHAIAALAPVAQDIVVTGHDGDECGFLIFPNVAACRAAAGLADDAPLSDVLAHPAVRERVRAGMAALRDAGGGTSSFAARALLLAEPPAIDAGEITDKGYINQRAVREHRAGLVALLHADPPDPAVITL
ncbi:MAG: feruloyl-CoA synthase [Betaproteobacteria bacterium]|nr:feruloyl-CoA synthase [Betaproteobacteria bacterium]